MENFYDIDHPVLGILGGLGPAASCYFYQMVTEHTQAARDQDHIDLVLSSRATTPDRTEFILGKCRTDPFAIMERDAQMLVRYGATVIAIPCNTAHYFFDRLAASLPVPVLHMPRLTVQQAIAGGRCKLGILATTGTVVTGAYQKMCAEQGLDCAVPCEEDQAALMQIIYGQIKQGKRADMAVFERISSHLKEQGCNMAVLGCTELSLVKRDEKLNSFYLDSSEVLAKRSIEACGKTPVGFSF